MADPLDREDCRAETGGLKAATDSNADNDDQVVSVLESRDKTSSSSSDSDNELVPEAVVPSYHIQDVLESQATTSSSLSDADDQVVPQAHPDADPLSDFEVWDWEEARELSQGSDIYLEDEQQRSPLEEQKVQENKQEQPEFDNLTREVKHRRMECLMRDFRASVSSYGDLWS